MLNSLNAGVSGLQQFQNQIDMIGNNIANVNTTGFKSARVNFADTFVEAMSGPGKADAGSSYGSGVATDGVVTSFKGGSITGTENVTDLAIENGQGFSRSSIPRPKHPMPHALVISKLTIKDFW